MTNAEPAGTTLVVSDRAVAALAAHAAEHAPGVVHLHQSPRQAARRAARQLTRRTQRTAAEAVELERDSASSDHVVVTIRVSIDTSVPVRQIVDTLQHRVTDDLARIAGLTATATVHVLDIRTS